MLFFPKWACWEQAILLSIVAREEDTKYNGCWEGEQIVVR